MLLPESEWEKISPVNVGNEFDIRIYRYETEGNDFIELMRSGGFESWSEETLSGALRTALPDGIFLAADQSDGRLLATAMATHNPSVLHPFGGELGWVCTRPEARGKGLGKAVCTSALLRFRSAGYDRVYLKTDDWRLPAIQLYLKLGFKPFLFAPGMLERWEDVCKKLQYPAAPDKWPCK